MSVPNLARFRKFVDAFGELVTISDSEADLLARGRPLLAELVRQDDWLPDAYARPDPLRYQQYLLHCDDRERFSVVSFVWGPGQSTPLHDHRVWGLIGMLRGAEVNEPWSRGPDGGLVSSGPPRRLRPGDVEQVSPLTGDIHRVSNGFSDRSSISIHIYGGDIGRIRRATYAPDGTEKPFVSGYSNRACPDIGTFQPRESL